MRGNAVSKQQKETNEAIVRGFTIMAAATPFLLMGAADPNVPGVESPDSPIHFTSDASWADYVVPLIKHQAFPLMITMLCWGALEAILRRPSGAVDRAKWALGGYLGLQFIMPFARNLGHKFGDD